MTNPGLPYLFLTFLRIGSTSWGGFMALISMIQKKVVEKDKNLEAATIMEGISMASVLPGPMAVNVVAFVGYKLGGWAGAFVSVIGVLLPSFLLMLILSHFYFLYGDLPAMSHFFSGILPAVAAIIISVAINLGEKSIKDIPQIVIAIVSAMLVYFSKTYVTTLVLLLISGTFGYFYYYQNKNNEQPAQKQETVKAGTSAKWYWTLAGAILVVFLGIWANQTKLFDLHKTISITFSGMSLSQFGGGYVIIPTMQKIVVDGMKWLTDREFVDAVAMGQITPGPIFVSATFIGYKLAGFWGALNATISIFFPTAILTIFCAQFFNKISSSNAVTAVFKGLRPAIIGMIASAALTILWNNGLTFFAMAVFSITLFVIIRFKVDPVYLIPLAGMLGILLL